MLERANRRVVGRLHKEHGVLFLVPEDRRITQDILIPPDQTRGGAKPGEVATRRAGRAALASTRSRSAASSRCSATTPIPGMEIEIALRKFDLPHEFSKKALAPRARCRRRSARTMAGP